MKKPTELLRDESKHKKYLNRCNICDDDCENCALAFKTDGDTSMLKEDHETAINCFLKALEIDHEFSETWNNLGTVYGRREEYTNSLEALNRALHYDPKFGKSLYAKAVTLKNLNRYDEALDTCSKILALYDNPQTKELEEEITSLMKQYSSRLFFDIQPVWDKVIESITNIKYITINKYPEELSYIAYGFAQKTINSVLELNDKEPMENPFIIACLFSAYGGIAARYYWDTGEKVLFSDTLFANLTKERGFEEMDEHICELIDLEFNSKLSKDITSMFSLFSFMAISEVGEHQNSQKSIDTIIYAGKILFLLGASIDFKSNSYTKQQDDKSSESDFNR